MGVDEIFAAFVVIGPVEEISKYMAIEYILLNLKSLMSLLMQCYIL